MTAWLKDVHGYGTHAARPAAGSEGALYYETDTDTLCRDNGSTWNTLTLGAVSPLITKGDLWVFGSADTRLPVGADGQVLTADSTQTRGVKWAAAGGGGSGALTQITETILGASAATIVLSSIPSTYRNLLLTLTARTDNSTEGALRLQMNADGGANYNWAQLKGVITTVAESESLGDTSLNLGNCTVSTDTAGRATSAQVTIFDYARTAWHKNVDSSLVESRFDSSAGQQLYKMSGVWRNTAAVTSLTLRLANGNFVAGSVVTLWGQV